MYKRPRTLNITWFRGRILFPILMFIGLGFSGYAQPENSYRVIVEGFAYGQGLSARDGAVADGKKRAIVMWLEANLGTYSPEDATYFLEQTDSLLLSHRILSQIHEDQGVRLTMEAYLDDPKLRLEAARYFLPRFKTMPKVVFLVGERHPQGNYTTGYQSTSITELKSAFEESGFMVVSEEVVNGFFTEIEIADRISGGPNSVAKVGRTVQADIVVMGEVSVGVQSTNQRGNLGLYHSEAKLSVVRAHDGQLVESTSAVSEVTSARPEDGIRISVEDSVYKVHQTLLVASVLASLGKPKLNEIHFTLEGDAIQRRLPEVLALLRTIPSVENIETLRTRPHTLFIRFGYGGRMGELVEQIGASTLKGLQLEARQVIGNDMHFRAIPR